LQQAARHDANNQDGDRQVGNVIGILGIGILLVRHNRHELGKCLRIKARDGERDGAPDIVGEVGVEVIDLHTDLDRLILPDARIEISRNGHDRYNMAGTKQLFGLLGAGLLQAERMRSTHRLVKLLRIGAAIIHHYRGRSGAAADHKQDHEE